MILKEDMLAKTSEKEIMEFYWGERLYDNKPIYKNPMRFDGGGSCYFKWYGDKYMFVDRARGVNANFDCFEYVMWQHDCSFREALVRINNDMILNVTDKLLKSSRNKTQKPKKRKKINFQIQLRKWNQSDKEYWNQFGISLNTVDKICKPVQSYKSDSNSHTFQLKYKYKSSDPCYVYSFKENVKLYQPLSVFSKWRSNSNNKDMFGYSILPHFGDDLYIASGGKDMLCLIEMGLNAIAPQSEVNIIPENILEDLKNRFNNIYIIYDNDNTGVEMSTKFAEEYNITNLLLPTVHDCKDIAELCKEVGLNKVKEIINEKRIKSNRTTNSSVESN